MRPPPGGRFAGPLSTLPPLLAQVTPQLVQDVFPAVAMSNGGRLVRKALVNQRQLGPSRAVRTDLHRDRRGTAVGLRGEVNTSLCGRSRTRYSPVCSWSQSGPFMTIRKRPPPRPYPPNPQSPAEPPA